MCDSNATQLKKEFGEIEFKEGETIDEFSLRIVGLANQIRVLDHPVADAEIVKKMLQVIPNHLSQIAIAIETFLDIDDISIEEVVGRLRQVEECELKKKQKASGATRGNRVDDHGRLLLTQDEWMAHLKLHADGNSGSSAANKKDGKTCCGCADGRESGRGGKPSSCGRA